MRQSAYTRATLFAAALATTLVSSCGSARSTGPRASGSLSKAQTCAQYKTVNESPNSSTGPNPADIILDLTTAQTKVRALARQTSDSTLSADLSALASSMGLAIRAGESGTLESFTAALATASRNMSMVENYCGSNH